MRNTINKVLPYKDLFVPSDLPVYEMEFMFMIILVAIESVSFTVVTECLSECKG